MAWSKDTGGSSEMNKFTFPLWHLQRVNLYIFLSVEIMLKGGKQTYSSAKSGVQLSESRVSGLSLFFPSVSPFSSRCPRDKSRLL